MISTATYQATVKGFVDHLDLSSDCARELIMSGVQLAKEAVKTSVCHPGTVRSVFIRTRTLLILSDILSERINT